MNRLISVIASLLVSWGMMTCEGLMAQNAPVSTIGVVTSYGSTATVGVTSSGFSNIGSFSIKILYDQAIVHPVSVTTSASVGGNLSVNLNNPGVIFLSWYTYPGLTLSGNPVILNIDFTKLAPGTSPLTWFDDGYSCAWYDGNSASLNDAPEATYYISGSLSFLSPDAPHSIASSVSACPGTLVSIPVRVTGFSNIGKVALTLNYDIPALAYQNFTNTSGFPGLAVDGSLPGTLIISGILSTGGSGFSLSDSSTLLTLNFNFLGGVANLIWFDDGVSCQHSGPPPSFFILNDSPQSTYYVNGIVSQIPQAGPAGPITGPPGGDVCAGQAGVNFSVAPIQHAEQYIWDLPPGAVVTSGALTNSIIVTFGNTGGNWDVTVTGSNICGSGPVSPACPVYVNTPPLITVQPTSSATVNAGNGTATFMIEAFGSFLTYQWQEFTATWNNLTDDSLYSGAMSPALTITNPPLAMNSLHYRCIIDGFCLPQAISNGEAMLAVSNLTGVENMISGESEEKLFLEINPNPATNGTIVRWFSPEDGHAVLEISSMFGKKITVLSDGNIARGSHKSRINVPMNRGLYLLTLSLQTKTTTYITTKKLIFE